MSETKLLTATDASAYTHEERVLAVLAVLSEWDPKDGLLCAATLAVDACMSVTPTIASDCPNVHPKFGQCVREYGHPPVVEGYVDEVDPDGHYTTTYEDQRRPDGSHPWDY